MSVSEKYQYQFDPLDHNGEVEVTCDGTAIARVASIKSAVMMCKSLNATDGLSDPKAAIEAAREALQGFTYNEETQRGDILGLCCGCHQEYDHAPDCIVAKAISMLKG